MGSISTPMKFPPEQLAFIEATIRQHHYARLDETLTTLKLAGIALSRSGLHRYAKRLERLDCVCPPQVKGTLVVIVSRASGRTWTVMSAASGEAIAQQVATLDTVK